MKCLVVVLIQFNSILFPVAIRVAYFIFLTEEFHPSLTRNFSHALDFVFSCLAFVCFFFILMAFHLNGKSSLFIEQF